MRAPVPRCVREVGVVARVSPLSAPFRHPHLTRRNRPWVLAGSCMQAHVADALYEEDVRHAAGQRVQVVHEPAALLSRIGHAQEHERGGATTLRALIGEYLFVSLFRACAESLASENASRLAAMQRADRNIDELLDDLNGTFQRLRQSGIDEELFEVISGFEALVRPR